MSRRTILIAIAIVMLIGLGGVGYIGWRWQTRHDGAAGNYRISLPEGVTMRQVVESERTLLVSDELLKGVIADLGLVEHWGMESEEEALAHMRKKLIVKPGKEEDRMMVLYLDRNKALAGEVLRAINDRYVTIKKEQQLLLGP
ncbi:MAG: hypothetical protein O3A87_06225 [Verrucomicrobia bacterium]|nr:hypothetical protein [Verrucomicrobiota bacterium]MDA1006062.1 hypothetical protein [Verrucomicrobiota bacterium]